MSSLAASQFDPGVLLIFVGYSDDGAAAADVIVGLEPHLQRELDKLRAVNPSIPYARVKVWKWANDAASAVGGQVVVITPELERANAAVFVFNERVGRVTWDELTYARGRTPPIPVLPFFPARPPAEHRLMDPRVAAEWADLLQKRHDLVAGWTEPDSKAITPLPNYTDPGQLGSLAAERLTGALVQMLRPFATGGAAAAGEARAPRSQAPRSWSPAVIYPLQPAPYFAGREELLAGLIAWARSADDPKRVVALVAAGGTGKTAVAERVVESLRGYTAAGVFVWSFYENPQTEAFLGAACEYFLGEAPRETGGLLERLQHGLRADARPHILILDGLELIQASGTTGRPRGALKDPLMRRFLQWLAPGLDTAAKALITSRFPLPDLEDRIGRGFHPIPLDDLDPVAARHVLRQRKVRGDDATLDGLADSVHRHALTVDVLGLYLHRFGNGDPKNAAKFDLKQFGQNQKAERLSKVLAEYAAKLPNDERDLLARLSLFPRGITLDYLGFISGEGKNIAGALSGYDQVRLLDMMEGLRELGLVFAAEVLDGRIYSAHPFLRAFFHTLLGTTKPEEVHEVVRLKLEAGLQTRPHAYPTSTPDLNFFEHLIEATRLSGRAEKAVELYERIGSIDQLSLGLGENIRGLRIVSGFSNDSSVHGLDVRLPPSSRATLAREWGFYLHVLGDIPAARACYHFALELFRQTTSDGLCHVLREIADVERTAGNFAPALEWAARACKSAERFTRHKLFTSSCMATARACAGDISGARHYFQTATQLQGSELFSGRGVAEAEFKYLTGDLAGSRSQLLNISRTSQVRGVARDIALCDGMLGIVYAAYDDLDSARKCLGVARSYGVTSGHMEVQLRCYRLAAEITRIEGNFSLATSEALDGIQLADSCGFGRWSLDIRTELAKTHLAAEDPAKAIEPAEWVLKRSQEPVCQYAWGEADSLHMLGVAHAHLGDATKAREYLHLAVAKRKPLEHPGLAVTEDELRKLGV